MDMSFAYSAPEQRKRAIETKIRRAITMAKVGTNPDFKLAHPDWVREAQTKNFTALKKQVLELIEKKQATAMKRRMKTIGK